MRQPRTPSIAKKTGTAAAVSYHVNWNGGGGSGGGEGGDGDGGGGSGGSDGGGGDGGGGDGDTLPHHLDFELRVPSARVINNHPPTSVTDSQLGGISAARS